MDDTRRLRGASAGPDRPRPGFLRARGQEGLQPERAEPGAGQLVQARLSQPGLSQQFGGLVLGQLGQVRLGLCVHFFEGKHE